MNKGNTLGHIETASIKDSAPFGAVLEAALTLLKQPGNLAVGVELVTAAEIRATNKSFRGLDKSTDVLSFPTLALFPGEVVSPKEHVEDTDPETGNVYLGDIILCDEIILQQAAEYGHSAERERMYLFCHGVLHLLGYDHMCDADKSVMRAKEEEIMRMAGIKN